MRALLREMICQDEASYDSMPLCNRVSLVESHVTESLLESLGVPNRVSF